MRIYRITTRHSQLVDVSTPHSQSDISGVGFQKALIFAMEYDSIIQGTWVKWQPNNLAYIGGIYNSSVTLNDEIRYKIYLAKGTYMIMIYTEKNTSRAIGELKIDDEVIDNNIDLYASSGTEYRYIKTGISISTDGIKTLKWKAIDKNASSGGYQLPFTYMAIIRTS